VSALFKVLQERILKFAVGRQGRRGQPDIGDEALVVAQVPSASAPFVEVAADNLPLVDGVVDVSEALGKLERDLASGAWAERYADLLDRDECDCGYRLVVSH
jgi:hypothetical protein